MSNHTMIAVGALALLAGLALGCESSGRDEGPGEDQITVGVEQETAMCEDLVTSSSTQPVAKTAGAEIGAGGAIDAQPGRKEILFTDFEGQLGGFIRLSINPENETPVFALLDDDVEFAAVDSSGAEVDYIEHDDGSDVCDDAAGRFLWVVAGSENHLRFGPTSADSVFLVLETVD